MTTRQERVKELLKVEISDIIGRELKDPRLGFVTITGAEVTKDLKHAKIYVSVYGDEKQKEESIAVLQNAGRYIRGAFARRVAMKAIPEIDFELDTAVEHGVRILELLRQVKPDDEE